MDAIPVDAGHSICGTGAGARITGTTYAPNGVDPIPGVLVYATPDTQTFPGPATSVTCEQCQNAPTGALASVQSSADGTFSLGGPALDAGGTFTVVLESGGFRHVERHVTVGMCASAALTASQTKLPGASSGDDTIPSIAVGSASRSDVNDRFAHVLDVMGITGYDKVDPDKSGTTTGSSDFIALLSNATRLDRYQIVIAPCGTLGNFTVAPNLTATMVNSLRGGLAAGGRLYASDLAYAVVAKPFPAAFTFAAGPSSRIGRRPRRRGAGDPDRNDHTRHRGRPVASGLVAARGRGLVRGEPNPRGGAAGPVGRGRLRASGGAEA